MKKCHKADHATIVELCDAYAESHIVAVDLIRAFRAERDEALVERDRARDLAAHLDDEIARIQRDTVARIQRGGTS